MHQITFVVDLSNFQTILSPHSLVAAILVRFTVTSSDYYPRLLLQIYDNLKSYLGSFHDKSTTDST